MAGNLRLRYCDFIIATSLLRLHYCDFIIIMDTRQRKRVRKELQGLEPQEEPQGVWPRKTEMEALRADIKRFRDDFERWEKQFEEKFLK